MDKKEWTEFTMRMPISMHTNMSAVSERVGLPFNDLVLVLMGGLLKMPAMLMGILFEFTNFSEEYDKQQERENNNG